MAVHQVEEYYIHISGHVITERARTDIESHLEQQGYAEYEFQDDFTVLVVDGIQEELEGDNLERELEIIINS